MMKIFFALCLLGAVLAQEDYCQSTLCRSGVTHVACNPNQAFGPACDYEARQVDLRGPLQQLIVDQHNLRRQQVATGNLTRFPSAAKMLEMTWDDDLAYIAGFNARQCVMKHDQCRATKRFPHAGQNLATHGQTNRYLDVGTSLLNMINNMWFGEHVNCPPELVYKFGPAPGKFGHFTTMIQQKSGKIGCAVTQYKNGKWFMTLMACNYQYTNMKDEEIYAVRNRVRSVWASVVPNIRDCVFRFSMIIC